MSTTITGLVAGSMVWLAAGAMPPLHSRTQAASTTFLPYQLFSQLAQAGSNLIGARNNDAAKQVTAPQTHLDNALADEEQDNATPQNETRTLTLDQGDTLVGLLQDAGVPDADANAAVVALTKVYDMRSLRGGQSFTVTFEAAPQAAPVHKPAKPANAARQIVNVNGKPVLVPGAAASPDSDGDNADVTPVANATGRMLSVEFSPTAEHDITIARQADNSFAANDVVQQLAMHTHRAGGTVDGSLYLTATQAGIPTDVVVAMIKMFSYKVDFQRDIKPGDSFEVYYSYYYTPDGRPARQGDIDYAVMKTGGRTFTLYRYQPDPSQPAEYFDAKGESVKGMLMKTPVDGARISSGFGMRFHPVLGYTRMHKGIDFAVPVGTPVMASGTGTVKIAGRSNGYGNYLRVDMGSGYGFAYGHLSRFAPGIHPGSHVHQGEVVAYSGNTGLSTGPHLHYETIVGGTQVNPLTLKIAQGRILAGRDKEKFQFDRLHLDAVLAETPLETKVADIATDLRQAKAR
jgi:murein DD-endopeptidase MepM/ murein hydrolase activator NlpD